MNTKACPMIGKQMVENKIRIHHCGLGGECRLRGNARRFCGKFKEHIREKENKSHLYSLKLGI